MSFTFQGIQPERKMDTLDAQDLTLFLTYQHVKSLRMKQLAKQIHKLGVSAGLNLEDVTCDLDLKEVIESNRNIERQSDTQDTDQHTKELVYSYLRTNGYHDVAEAFATKCNLPQKIGNSFIDLETIFQSKGTNLIPQTNGERKRKTSTQRRLVAGVDFIDTGQVKFTNANSRGGAIIMTYKGLQYCFRKFTRNQQVSHWQCRRHGALKCHGYLQLCNKTTTVIKEIPHTIFQSEC